MLVIEPTAAFLHIFPQIGCWTFVASLELNPNIQATPAHGKWLITRSSKYVFDALISSKKKKKKTEISRLFIWKRVFLWASVEASLQFRILEKMSWKISADILPSGELSLFTTLLTTPTCLRSVVQACRYLTIHVIWLTETAYAFISIPARFRAPAARHFKETPSSNHVLIFNSVSWMEQNLKSE